jgi:hypothetical protein
MGHFHLWGAPLVQSRCVSVPAARSPDRHPASPMVASTARLARPSADRWVPRVPGRDRGGGSPTRGYGTQKRARVPGEGKSRFWKKVNGSWGGPKGLPRTQGEAPRPS